MSNLISSAMGAVFYDPEGRGARTFTQDFKQLFSLSDSAMQDCLTILPDYRLTRLPSEKKEILDVFSEKHPTLPRPKIECAFSVLNFFIRQLMDTDWPSDDSSKWGGDLETLNVLASEDRSRFDSLISSLKGILEETVSKEVERRKTAQQIMPFFHGCKIAVNMRGVLKEKYIYGTPWEKFQPEFTDTAIVSAMNIVLVDHSDNEKTLYFNLEESHIDNLINCLQAAKKEIIALKEYCKKQ